MVPALTATIGTVIYSDPVPFDDTGAVHGSPHVSGIENPVHTVSHTFVSDPAQAE